MRLALPKHAVVLTQYSLDRFRGSVEEVLGCRELAGHYFTGDDWQRPQSSLVRLDHASLLGEDTPEGVAILFDKIDAPGYHEVLMRLQLSNPTYAFAAERPDDLDTATALFLSPSGGFPFAPRRGDRFYAFRE